MKKAICSPSMYIQGEHEIQFLATHTEKIGLKSAYLIVASFVLDKYGKEMEKEFQEKNMKYHFERFGGECSETEINKHAEKAKEYDCIIGVGGGKTLDTAKACAYFSSKRVIIVPTACSSDAPCSRLSVIYLDNGEFSHYLPLPSNPDIVVLDTKVILDSPVRLLKAGIGDALATYFEAAACDQSQALTMTGARPIQAATMIAKLCLDTLLKDAKGALDSMEKKEITESFENIVEANTYLSGIGFESGGLAAAHAVHNGMTALEETHEFLHGEKVAVGTLCQLVLEKRPKEEIQKIVDFCKELKLPISLNDLNIKDQSRERLLKVGEIACSKEDTMGNMPFEVTPKMVVDALLELNNL